MRYIMVEKRTNEKLRRLGSSTNKQAASFEATPLFRRHTIFRFGHGEGWSESVFALDWFLKRVSTERAKPDFFVSTTGCRNRASKDVSVTPNQTHTSLLTTSPRSGIFLSVLIVRTWQFQIFYHSISRHQSVPSHLLLTNVRIITFRLVFMRINPNNPNELHQYIRTNVHVLTTKLKGLRRRTQQVRRARGHGHRRQRAALFGARTRSPPAPTTRQHSAATHSHRHHGHTEYAWVSRKNNNCILY